MSLILFVGTWTNLIVAFERVSSSELGEKKKEKKERNIM